MSISDERPAVTMMPMVQLPSGVAIRADKVLFIVRKEIGQYLAFFEGATQAPHLTGEDLDFLRSIGAVQGGTVVEAEEAKIVS